MPLRPLARHGNLVIVLKLMHFTALTALEVLRSNVEGFVAVDTNLLSERWIQ
jgi:hypothetical protein